MLKPSKKLEVRQECSRNDAIFDRWTSKPEKSDDIISLNEMFSASKKRFGSIVPSLNTLLKAWMFFAWLKTVSMKAKV